MIIMKNSLYKNFKSRIDNLISDNINTDNVSNENTISNEEKIKLHSELILLQMYIAECMNDIQEDDEDYERQMNSHNRIIDKINAFILKLNLSHRIVGSGIIDIVLEYLRLFGVLLTMLCFAIVLTIPCVVFIISDHFLVEKLHLLSNHQRFNIILKRITGYILLMMSGIILVVEDYRIPVNEDDAVIRSNNDKRSWNTIFKYFTSMPSINLMNKDEQHQQQYHHNMLCFTHASSIDPFVLSVLVVEPSYTFGKSDLFMLPYFGWLIAVWGGVSIDRSNQNRAIQTLKSVKDPECVTQWCHTIPSIQGLCNHNTNNQSNNNTSSNSNSSSDNASSSIISHNNKVVVAIAPEGTRSVTGQVLSFKKGPFYLWDHLDQPPIYPLVIMGAYELMPPPYATSKALHTVDDSDSKKEIVIANNNNTNSQNSYALLSTNQTTNMINNGIIQSTTQLSNTAAMTVKKILQNRKPVCATPGKVIVRLLPPICNTAEINHQNIDQMKKIKDIEASNHSILNEYEDKYRIDLEDFMIALNCLKPEQQQQQHIKALVQERYGDSVMDAINTNIMHDNSTHRTTMNDREDVPLLHSYVETNTITTASLSKDTMNTLSSKSIYRDNPNVKSVNNHKDIQLKNEINNNNNNNMMMMNMIDNNHTAKNKVDNNHIISPIITREQISQQLKLSILTSLATNYPSNVGCPLSNVEYRIHLLFLFSFVCIDIILLRYIFYICMMKYYQYSIFNAILLFILYTIIMTMLIYIIKVKLPHYIS